MDNTSPNNTARYMHSCDYNYKLQPQVDATFDFEVICNSIVSQQANSLANYVHCVLLLLCGSRGGNKIAKDNEKVDKNGNFFFVG